MGVWVGVLVCVCVCARVRACLFLYICISLCFYEAESITHFHCLFEAAKRSDPAKAPTPQVSEMRILNDTDS